jgi:hypothetical protein
MPERSNARLDAHDGVQRVSRTFVSLLRLFVIIGASVVLTSLAGVAVYAAPITVPLLALVAATSRGRGWRAAATVVAALTFLEVAWMLIWVLWNSTAGSFVGGVAAALVLTYAFWNVARPAQPARCDSARLIRAR